MTCLYVRLLRNDPLAKKILVKLALGVSYIPRPNRIRIKSTCSVVIANLEIFLVYLPPSRKEDCSIIVIFFCHFNAYLPQVCSYHNSFSFFQLFYKGNNIYGEEIRRILLKKPESRSQFILMDRIQPKLNTNILVRQDSAVSECTDVIPELGIVGIVVRYVPTYRANTIPTWQAEVSFGD